MKRLTTNCPDNNLDAALNLFYIKDFEAWVRGGGDGPDYPDIRLYDFIRKAAKILLPDLESSIGKTIFLNREEAEKALEAKSND